MCAVTTRGPGFNGSIRAHSISHWAHGFPVIVMKTFASAEVPLSWTSLPNETTVLMLSLTEPPLCFIVLSARFCLLKTDSDRALSCLVSCVS